jgi:hypothetical protein
MKFRVRALLVTIYDLDVAGVAVAPLETNTPLLVDPNAILDTALPSTVLFEPVARVRQVA